MRTGDRVSGWIRRRELASDRRAGRFSRTEAIKRQYAWVRRNWWIVTAHVVFVLATLPLALLLPTWGRGPAAGAWLATGFWFLAFEVVLASGTAPRMMGDRGEQFTATELRRLRRHGWRVINHVALRPTWDIDHVAIGPGGVLVIETKWSGDAWTLDADLDSRVDRAVERIAANATDIRLMFPEHVAPTAVIPLLVLWGGYKADDGGVRVLDGVTVLRGVELRNWLGTLGTGHVYPRAARSRLANARTTRSSAGRGRSEARRSTPEDAKRMDAGCGSRDVRGLAWRHHPGHCVDGHEELSVVLRGRGSLTRDRLDRPSAQRSRACRGRVARERSGDWRACRGRCRIQRSIADRAIFGALSRTGWQPPEIESCADSIDGRDPRRIADALDAVHRDITGPENLLTWDSLTARATETWRYLRDCEPPPGRRSQGKP